MIKAVLFDIDGTLIDSFEANLVFYQNLMKAAGYPPQTREHYGPILHKPTWEVIPILTGVSDEKERKRIFDLAHDPKIKSPRPILSEGAEETIKILSASYKLGVVSSRMKQYLYEPPLHRIKHYMNITIGFEDTTAHKPNPEPLLLAAKEFTISPGQCVYIGDADTDMEAARNAGTKFILYTGPGSSGKSLQAEYSIGKLVDIPAILASLF